MFARTAEGIVVSGTDRGAERRRLLAAVRDDESESNGERSQHRGAPSPATDGGTVTLAAPLFHCADCDRSYLEPPATCDGCGATEFVERTLD